MAKSIDKLVNDVIQKASHSFKDEASLRSFESASKNFDNLVEKGLIERRGYNLMTIEKKHLQQFNFNV